MSRKVTTEIERRFIVHEIDPIAFSGAHMLIDQGYIADGTRIRILDQVEAVLTRKTGHGQVRTEHNFTSFPLEIAQVLMESTQLTLRKRRYVREGWEIDVYDNELKGLIVAEREMKSEDEVVQLPWWIKHATEVTNSLSNELLAHIAAEHRRTQKFVGLPSKIEIPGPIPRIVLTGSPCSGKSTLIQYVREEMGTFLHCVPEVATIVISQIGVIPPLASEDMASFVFQRNMTSMQLAFEQTASLEVQYRQKSGLVLDRGLFDNAAYLPGRRRQFDTMIGEDKVPALMARYDLVLCLAAPPEDIFNKMRENNHARKESYAEVLELEKAVIEAWEGHPNFHHINGANWHEKLAHAVHKISEFIS